MRPCARYGAENRDEARFCDTCGVWQLSSVDGMGEG